MPDEVEDQTIDFRWFRFIGRKKLGYTDKETMRLTLRNFTHDYNLYKEDYDNELCLLLSRTTYKKAKEDAIKQQEWT